MATIPKLQSPPIGLVRWSRLCRNTITDEKCKTVDQDGMLVLVDNFNILTFLLGDQF